ncbi:MAG TPA: endonuclease V [Nocardioidaceae bacterium]|nr:endonuclease V [Nocardioidaceae bacterium]
MWPTDEEQLAAVQLEIAAMAPPPWSPTRDRIGIGGCWACFPRGLSGPGAAGDPAWTASVVMASGRIVARHTTTGAAAAAYTPGLLALRDGALPEDAVRGLADRPDVLLLDATGRDHPRGCGLATHLGAVLDLPTVGVTHRPLLARGDWPADRQGATAPLRIDDAMVGCWLRTRAGARPLAVHPGWRADLDTAVGVVSLALAGRRTPEPLRGARRLARRSRAADAG